jgi:hypothetical protein
VVGATVEVVEEVEVLVAGAVVDGALVLALVDGVVGAVVAAGVDCVVAWSSAHDDTATSVDSAASAASVRSSDR